jgi:hypothetical protein
MTGLRIGHPSEGDLLRFADGEVSRREAKRIQAHLAACWACRTALAELQETVGECVRYRQSVLHQALPDPPGPWFDIYRQFDQLDAAHEQRPWLQRLRESLRARIAQPRFWAPAVALLVIVFILVDQFRNAPAVQAAELLHRAAAAEESRSLVPRRIGIRTGTRRLTRVIGVQSVKVAPQDEQAAAELQRLFATANYNWDDPLSAASFASWRNSLAEKQDQVSTIGDSSYRIRTTTDSSELAAATLDLRIKDLQPVESTLRFRGGDFVELSELDAAPTVEPPAAAASIPPPRAHAGKPAPEVARPATPGEELKVLAVLHRLGADLGEPVEVTRDGGQIVVTGVGVTPELSEQIQDELTGIPRVSVRLADPVSGPVQALDRSSQSVSLRPEIAQLHTRLESYFGGRAELEQFTDEVLRASDDLMSRVHALRRLAQRFPAEVESQLTAEDRQLLARLRREHAVAVAGLALALEERTRPALLALGSSARGSERIAAAAAPWQSATEALFEEARASESLLAAMLGGASAGISPEELSGQALSSIARLRARAAEYVQNALE